MINTPVKNTDFFLNNLQANILKGHGRNFAHHLFLRINESKINLARNWIAQFAASPNGVTSARQQVEATAAFKAGKITDGGIILTLSLTAKGYDKLGLADTKPSGNAFAQGMRGSAALLGDNPDAWEAGFKDAIDMLIIVADDDSSVANKAADAVVQECNSFATLLINQRGNILKTKSGIGIEHFGYADGISQPLFLEEDISRQPTTVEWDDATDPNLVLVGDNTGEPDSFGSFFVFRKLEQDVKKFNAEEKALPRSMDVSGKINDELAGAMIVGRFENSLPVVKSSTGVQTNPPVINNDFNYADDLPASKCPFHSHIRLMNPRKGDRVAGDVSAHRIARRGIPYDEIGRIPEDRITSISDDLLNANQPTAGIGLLFMCYQSNIENQFEILQGFWANRGNIGGHQVGAQDSLIGQESNPDKTLPVQWGQASQSNPFAFKNFVTTKGGEYFFTPSIPFLKGLGTSAAAR